MNRKIKFRGKSIEGNWVYGDLIQRRHKGTVFIEYIKNGTHYLTVVEPETVGQYTGSKDKNSEDIYEGDIVVGIRDDFGRPINIKATIYYDNGAFRESYYGDCVNRHQDRDGIYLEIIGNIYENTELLKGD